MLQAGKSLRHAALPLSVLLIAPFCRAEEVIQGRVLLDDLIPPASPVAVQLQCEGKTVAKTKADEHGRFTLQAASHDPSACRLTAAAPGYEPDAVALDRLPLEPEIGALVLRRSGKWNGYALSVTTLTASPEARELFEGAVRAMREGGQDGMAQAEEAFAHATEADPNLAEAWHQLGRLRLARHDVEAGRAALRRAVEADPWYVSPYRPLLLLELGDEHWTRVLELGVRLLQLDPYLADIRYYCGLASLNTGDLEGAAKEAQAIAQGPESASFPLVDHLRGLIFEQMGRPLEARSAYQRYLESDPDGAAADEVRLKLQGLEAQ